MTKRKIRQMTGSYEDYLLHSLRDKEECVAYLQVALEEYQKDNNAQALLLALRHVAQAQGGIAHLAQKAHLNRESLYKTLSGKGNPRLQTLGALLKGLGFRLSIQQVDD